METAKLFMNGGSQAVRIPKEYRFEGDEVCIKMLGDGIIMLFPKDKARELAFKGLYGFTDDFMENGRIQGELPTRESL